MLMLGGPLTVTDANLVLGRLLPDYFPHIFGEKENQPLDAQATHDAFDSLTEEVLHVVVAAVTFQKNEKILPLSF